MPPEVDRSKVLKDAGIFGLGLLLATADNAFGNMTTDELRQALSVIGAASGYGAALIAFNNYLSNFDAKGGGDPPDDKDPTGSI